MARQKNFMKDASCSNFENTFIYPIVEGELIFYVLSVIGVDLDLQNSTMRVLKILGGVSRGCRVDTYVIRTSPKMH